MGKRFMKASIWFFATSIIFAFVGHLPDLLGFIVFGYVDWDFQFWGVFASVFFGILFLAVGFMFNRRKKSNG